MALRAHCGTVTRADFLAGFWWKLLFPRPIPISRSRIFAFFMSVQLHTALHCYCTINQSSLLHKRAQSAHTRAIDLPFKLFLLKIVPLVNCPCTARARARNLDRRNSNKTPERARTTSERAMPWPAAARNRAARRRKLFQSMRRWLRTRWSQVA